LLSSTTASILPVLADLVLRPFPIFSGLGQAKPDLRHVMQYGSCSRLAKIVREAQTLCGVLSIFFRLSHQRPSLPEPKRG